MAISPKRWEMVKYFPKYKLKQLPNKEYLFTVLSSLRGEELSELLYKAMKKRSIYKDRLNDEYVKISNNWIEQFQNVVDLPSKTKILTFNNKRKIVPIVEYKG